MALPSSGPISIGDINVEKGLPRNTAGSSLAALSTTDLTPSSIEKPDAVAPHKLSEFFGYTDAGNVLATPTLQPATPLADGFQVNWVNGDSTKQTRVEYREAGASTWTLLKVAPAEQDGTSDEAGV